jgi:hypothetical protein
LTRGPRLRRVDLEVGVAPPSLAVAVERRFVPSDEPRLQHERFGLALFGGDALDALHRVQEVLHLLAFVAVEVGPHARAEVDGLAYV